MNGNYDLMSQHCFYSLIFALAFVFIGIVINLFKKKDGKKID